MNVDEQPDVAREGLEERDGARPAVVGAGGATFAYAPYALLNLATPIVAWVYVATEWSVEEGV